jgi:hypothetical protein
MTKLMRNHLMLLISEICIFCMDEKEPFGGNRSGTLHAQASQRLYGPKKSRKNVNQERMLIEKKTKARR